MHLNAFSKPISFFIQTKYHVQILLHAKILYAMPFCVKCTQHITFINHILKSFTCQSHISFSHAIVPYTLPSYVFMRKYISSVSSSHTKYHICSHISVKHIHSRQLLIFMHCMYLHFISTYTIPYRILINLIYKHIHIPIIISLYAFIYISHIPILYTYSIYLLITSTCMSIIFHVYHIHKS